MLESKKSHWEKINKGDYHINDVSLLLGLSRCVSCSPARRFCTTSMKRAHREKRCDVTLPWQQNFWILTIFPDRDSHLHCRTMEEKYGLSVESWTGNSYMAIFSFFISAIFAGPQLAEIQKFCYHGNVT